MSTGPEISALVIVHNEEALIERCLASLEGAYELLLAASKAGTATLTDAERSGVAARLAAIKEIRTAKKGA